MADRGNTIPLIALDAVVIDTETTGLDPARARVIEIAAVPLHGGRLHCDDAHEARIRPDQPVPASATAVHGIDDEALRDAPDFREVWARFAAQISDRVVIGHSIGFDLATLRHECLRAGADWVRPRCLDISLLARAARPDLAGYSIDELTAWLGVEPAARHSALGDAVMAGRIFLALVPKLRERGIRTLAEAEQASRQFTSALEQQHRAGWEDVTEPASNNATKFDIRLDTHPFRHRVGEIMSPPKSIQPDEPVLEAARRMDALRISSLFVASDVDATLRPETTGIVTERDVLRAIARRGASAIDETVRGIATAPLLTVPAGALIYRAMAYMRRHKVRHLGVTDEAGDLCGAVSARDLLRQRAEEAIWLGEEIDEAADAPQLARGWTRLPLIAEALLADGMSGREVAGVISHELCALTSRAVQLADEHMQREGHGEAPCPYAFAVLGSAGRGESLLAMDQDNAIIFAEGAPGAAADQWFEKLAIKATDILHEVGVPYCPGGVMARDPAWRGCLATWRDRVSGWIRRSKPNDLLSVDIFFDLRGVHGDPSLAARLRREAFDMAAGEISFAKLLVDASGGMRPGLGFLGRFRTEQGRLDVKKTGLFGLVAAARALAIRHHVLERSTPGRLAAIRTLDLGAEQDLDALIEAHGVFLDLILAQQIVDMANGVSPGNTVAVKRLSHRDRSRLRSALESVGPIEDMTRDLLFQG